MTIVPATTVAAIATEHPAAIKVFQRHGIDFCCGGKRPLAEACAERNVSAERVIGEIESVLAPRDELRDWRQAPLADLAQYIVERYHETLRDELPRLSFMTDKVNRVHGARWPEMIPPLASTFEELRRELESHMEDEEASLFPAVVALEARAGAPAAATGDFGSTIEELEREHEHAGRLLERMHALTGGFTPPAEACNTFRGLFHGLAQLTADMHVHVHLENNLLFPRAIALRDEAQKAGATGLR
jgi:regulator of cell morphogenesis and NO signaling